MPKWYEREELISRRKTRDVKIELDGEEIVFRLRSLSAREWFECVSATAFDGEVQPELMTRFVAYSLLDDSGRAPYATEEGVEKVAEWDAGVVRKLFEEVSDLNGMNEKK